MSFWTSVQSRFQNQSSVKCNMKTTIYGNVVTLADVIPLYGISTFFYLIVHFTLPPQSGRFFLENHKERIYRFANALNLSVEV